MCDQHDVEAPELGCGASHQRIDLPKVRKIAQRGDGRRASQAGSERAQLGGIAGEQVQACTAGRVNSRHFGGDCRRGAHDQDTLSHRATDYRRNAPLGLAVTGSPRS